MKKLVILLFLLSSLCIPAFAQDICFTNEVASRMIVDLEQKNNYENQVVLYKEGNRELEYQVQLLKEVNELRKEQLNQYERLVNLQKDSYEAIIKESKPSIGQKIFEFISLLGLGVAIGALIF